MFKIILLILLGGSNKSTEQGYYLYTKEDNYPCFVEITQEEALSYKVSIDTQYVRVRKF